MWTGEISLPVGRLVKFAATSRHPLNVTDILVPSDLQALVGNIDCTPALDDLVSALVR
jgi:hypothetical protein